MFFSNFFFDCKRLFFETNAFSAARFVIINKLLKNSSKNLQKQTGEKSKHPMLSFVSLVASSIALLSTVWIILPAPSYYVWLFSVAASEWSLYFGALALAGIVCSLIFGGGKVRLAAVFIGAVALLISLYPFFSALSAAQNENVSLSFGQYFASFQSENNSTNDKKTFTFAETGGKPLQLDVYFPPNDVPKNGASVVVVHGGSWNAGGRGDFPQWNFWLARQGFMVFDIDYTLAPQPNYLSATGDVKCAVVWIKKNAAHFNVSPDKIVLLGRSAGAHLALLAAYSAGDAQFPASCPGAQTNDDTRADESVRAVVSFYAPTDLIWGFDNPANRFVINGQETLRGFLGGNPHESVEMRERYLSASPTTRVDGKTPPTLLIHGGQDQLVKSENMDLLAEKLQAANVSHKVLFFSYAQHGFDYNFNGWGAQVTKFVMLDFLRENTE